MNLVDLRPGGSRALARDAREGPGALARRKGLAAASLLLGVALFGCNKASGVCPNGFEVDISGNHGHELAPPENKGQRYKLVKGTHEHGVAVRDTDLLRLEDGESATTLASSTNAHTHQVTLKCKP